MTDFLSLPSRERADILAGAADEIGIPPGALEKDIWICWALERVFTMPDAPPMAFKGGTSLSKVFNAIRRFSEDVDISVDYRSFAEIPTAVGDLSGTQARKLSECLREALARHVETKVRPWLEASAERQFGAGAVRFELAPDGERLDIHYPDSIVGTAAYLAPKVILEFGGRNPTTPNSTHRVTTYAAPLFPDLVFSEARVVALSPERTFWEKATMIHVECFRGLRGAQRLSRHWTDLATLADHEIGRRALMNRDLALEVVAHKKAFWRAPAASGASYDDCVSGNLVLVPHDPMRRELRDDLERMVKAGMFLGDRPDFVAVMERISRLQREINIGFHQGDPGEGGVPTTPSHGCQGPKSKR